MSEAVTGQSQKGTERIFSTPIGKNPYFPEVDSTTEEQSIEAAESEQDTEPTAAADAQGANQGGEGQQEESFVGEDERRELDTNSPEYKHLFAAYTRARQRDAEKLKKALEDAQKSKPIDIPEAVKESAQEQTPADEDDPYNYNFKDVTPVVSFPDESDLKGYEAELVPVVKQVVEQMLGHALKIAKQRDQKFAEKQQLAKAHQTISEYAKVAEQHPDWDKHRETLAGLAQDFAQVAIKDPAKWIRLAELETGITRDWQEKATVAPSGNGQAARLATKTQASTPRPTRTSQSAPVKRSDMTLDEALEAAYKKHGIG